MAVSKRSAAKPAAPKAAAKAAAAKAAAAQAAAAKPAAVKARPAAARKDPQVELFGRGVAAAQQKHWRDAAALFRRVLHDIGDEPGLGERARQYLALCEQRLVHGNSHGHDEDPYLQAVFEKNRGEFATALALCRRGGRHRRDERMAYLAASILALEGEFDESAELLALAVGQNPKNRVQAFHDSDFADVLGRSEFAFILDPS